MKPLIVLLITFCSSLLILWMATGSLSVFLAGNIAMSVMLVFTAIGHFVFTQGMAMMMPAFIPFKKAMVHVTGIIEIAVAVGLLISSLQEITAYLLIVFFSVMLPCNIYAAVKKVDYQKASYNGPGLNYLWFRIPMQLFLIAWVYVFDLYF